MRFKRTDLNLNSRLRPSIGLEHARIQGNQSDQVNRVHFSENDGKTIGQNNYYPLSHAGIQALQSDIGGRGRYRPQAEMVGFVAMAGNAATCRISLGTPAAASPLFFWGISGVGLEH